MDRVDIKIQNIPFKSSTTERCSSSIPLFLYKPHEVDGKSKNDFPRRNLSVFARHMHKSV